MNSKNLFNGAQLMISTILPSVVSADNSSLRNAVECTPRGGLPNFIAKLKKGESVKIAYFGGSITEQSGWRVQSLAYFQKMYPMAKLNEVNAAIGGTGSMLGVFRIERDVFRYKPDMVFVEFAVNDSEQEPAEIVKSMEGIIRKTWKQYPDCDICFVYTLTEKLLPDLRQGKFPYATGVMEQLADHYNIPSIHMGLEVVRLEKKGKLQMKAPNAEVTRVSGKELDQNAPLRVTADGKIPFAGDGVHPYNDTGHRLYTEAIIRSFPAIKTASSKPGQHILSAPVDSNNLENSVMLPVDQAQMTGPWRKLADGELKNNMHESFGSRVPALWNGRPGAELSFRFKGSKAMIYDILGPEGCKLEVTTDGKTVNTVRMDGYCTYHHLFIVEVAKDLDPQKIHEVKIKVLPDKLDKEKIIMESRRNDFHDNPSKYAETNWYAGAIFMVGELVK